MASLKQLQRHPRVQHVDDERRTGNGILVTLMQGFSIDPHHDSRVFGEDTISAALDSVRHMAQPYGGPFEN